MANQFHFKPTRTEMRHDRTHQAWREIVDAQAAARDEKLERLAHARAVREAKLAGEPPPEPVKPKKARKPRKR